MRPCDYYFECVDVDVCHTEFRLKLADPLGVLVDVTTTAAADNDDVTVAAVVDVPISSILLVSIGGYTPYLIHVW